MKIATTAFFDADRGCWRVRFRGASLDTKLNVPDEVFEREGVKPSSDSKRAENVAHEWAVARKSDILQAPTRLQMTLRQVYDLMRLRNPEKVTAATWARNDIHIRNLERLPSSRPLSTLAPDIIDREAATQYGDERLEEGAASRTVLGELAFLKQLLRFGFEDAATKSGMTGVRFTKLPKVESDEQEMVALTVDQFFAVLEATHRVMPRGADITRRRLIFGVTTLLRKSPLMNLAAEWIDVADTWLDVPAVAQKGKGKKKRPLSVPLCGWAVEQLPRVLPKSGFVWANVETGKAVGNVTRTLQKLAEAARVPQFSLHDLRATGNTWLTNAGVDLRIRQYLMGHKDGGPVISRYTKITADAEGQLRDAVAVFDGIRVSKEKNVASFFSARRSA